MVMRFTWTFTYGKTNESKGRKMLLFMPKKTFLVVVMMFWDVRMQLRKKPATVIRKALGGF